MQETNLSNYIKKLSKVQSLIAALLMNRVFLMKYNDITVNRLRITIPIALKI